MNPQPTPPDGEWGPCPTGELGRMVGRIRAKRRTTQVRRIGGTVAALALFSVVLVGGRSILRNSTGEIRYGGLACSEVAPKLKDFHEGKLPAPLADKIRIHLAECPDCGAKYKKMFGKLAQSVPWKHRRHTVADSPTRLPGFAYATVSHDLVPRRKKLRQLAQVCSL
ncbi:MAG: zf-HC2 domain-containing protein [Pirellulales bacterium]